RDRHLSSNFTFVIGAIGYVERRRRGARQRSEGKWLLIIVRRVYQHMHCAVITGERGRGGRQLSAGQSDEARHSALLHGGSARGVDVERRRPAVRHRGLEPYAGSGGQRVAAGIGRGDRLRIGRARGDGPIEKQRARAGWRREQTGEGDDGGVSAVARGVGVHAGDEAVEVRHHLPSVGDRAVQELVGRRGAVGVIGARRRGEERQQQSKPEESLFHAVLIGTASSRALPYTPRSRRCARSARSGRRLVFATYQR